MTFPPDGQSDAGAATRRRLYAYNGGFFFQKRLRRILDLAGYDLRLGKGSQDDLVAIWGQSPTAWRGHHMAERSGAGKLFVEDAFLRSVLPGRAGKQPPIGLFLDSSCPHFDPSVPSDLETLLASHPLDDAVLLNRARGAIARLQEAHLTKYTGVDPSLAPPKPGYVLVIDQTRGDASVTASKADDAAFQEMLVFAQEEHPGCSVLIKTHPETAQGLRQGYFGPEHETDRVKLCTAPYSPWVLFEGAVGVYTVSSQMGFEAIFAGHKPRVFGQPFYAGWGLTSDERPVPRRQRKLTRAQLFAAAMILYPKWYDPCRDRLCDLETAMDLLEAQTRSWREDRHGWSAFGMRFWKRNHIQKFFGQHRGVQFDKTDDTRPAMVWGMKDGPKDAMRVEDGFLRSRGLGAELVPPLSLVCDDLGIYYDPSQVSRLETLIQERDELRPDQALRADKLVERIRKLGISKYNLDSTPPSLPEGRLILVPGQVEDDASILLGTSEIRTNADLLKATREANPDAIILYKPHPDVTAGLRSGHVPDPLIWADQIVDGDMAQLLERVAEVWTMTSGTGFEALMRGVRVVTFGAPFYAGWGLTDDRGDIPDRRTAEVPLNGLVHAALIDYPRYYDPATRQPCSVEVAIDRLSSGRIPHPGLLNRTLSKLQGAFATYASLWR